MILVVLCVLAYFILGAVTTGLAAKGESKPVEGVHLLVGVLWPLTWVVVLFLLIAQLTGAKLR